MSQIKLRFKWHYLGLSAILLVSIILNFYKLGQEGYGNLYYSVAVKSMLTSWHNFFFNSFDPKGFITIDKPPVAFWFQALSAYLFGFKGWSLFFPQALAGVLSVALLYHLVARVFGTWSGLLSALFLALTPIVVATDRTNEVDSILMFVILIATWAISKTTEQNPLKWLLFAFFLVGVGFNIKMMEAFLVLPAFYLFYLLSAKLTWLQKLVHLLCATVVLVVVSCSWSVIVDSIPPDQRPYIGSSQNNSMIELAIGYNGINRLIGQQHGIHGNSWLQQSQYADSQLGEKIVRRNENPDYHSFKGQHRSRQNSQIKQNIVSKGRNHFLVGRYTRKLGLLRLFISPQLVGQLSWLLPGVLISVVSLLWSSHFRAPFERKRQMVIFWTVWVLTMFIFFSHTADMLNSYYMVMLAPGIAALAGVGFKEMWEQLHSKDKIGAWFLPLALVSNACFEISVVWMYPKFRTTLSLTIVILVLLALICLLYIQKLKNLGKRRISIIGFLAGVLALVIAPTVWALSPIQYGGSVSRPFAGPELKTQWAGNEKTSSPKLENYLKANYRDGSFLVATIDATTAAPIILDTNLPVMAMGGFKGSDPALTVKKLQKMANDGQIRYFLLQGMSRGNDQTALINWIRTNSRIVPTYKWQDIQSKTRKDQVWSGSGNSSMRLYGYVKNDSPINFEYRSIYNTR
ncbi:MAG: glycosyltransferase family 39 protein [Bacillota bacterium]|nr:glycosyltransferase family 39 protein [Bacillota bacterium]